MKLLTAIKIPTLLYCFLFAISPVSKSQQNIHKLYSVAGGQLDHLMMTAAENGDVLIACNYAAVGNYQLMLQRINSSGTVVWAKAYRSAGNVLLPASIAATKDNGVIVSMVDTLQMTSIRLVKFSSSGTIAWARSFYAAYYSMFPVPLFELPDGSIIMSHSSQDSLLLKKLDASGNIIWEKSFNNSSTSVISPSAIAYSNGEIYVGGYDNDSYSGFLIKTDGSGNLLWQQNKAGDIGISLRLLAAPGGVFVATRPTSIIGNIPDTRFFFTSSTGAAGWAKTLSFKNARLFRISPNLVGVAAVNNGTVQLAVVDNSGTIKDSRSYHDPFAGNAVEASGNRMGCWIAGISNNKLWLMSADSFGNTNCFMEVSSLNAPLHNFNTGNPGWTTGSSSTVFSNLVFSSQDLNVTDSALCSDYGTAPVSNGTVCPNPIHGKLIIKLPAATVSADAMIVDVMGRIIYRASLSQRVTVNTSGWPAGMYILQLHPANRSVITTKILKQ